MKIKNLISEQARKNIEECIRDIETHTNGELVPMIVGASDTYAAASWRCALAFGLFMTGLFYSLNPHFDFLIYLSLEIPLILLGLFLVQIPCIKRFFLTRSEIDEEVYQRAIQAFYENKLHHTENRTGILIFVSYLEHRALILADTGINKVVPEGTWDSILAKIIEAMKCGKIEEGFCEAIQSCGRILKKSFPAEKTPNELSNKFVVE